MLKGFNRKEMTRFYAFSMSPYFNKHKDVQQLVKHLNQLFPKYTEINCDRKALFQVIYPKETFDQAQLALLFTYTQRLVERFLVQEEFKPKEGYSRLLLMRNLRTRKQYPYYERIMRIQNQQAERAIYRDSDYFNIQFLTAEEADNYHTELSRHEKDHSIQQKQDSLDHYYLSVKLRDACEMRLRSKILKVEYSTGLLDAVLVEVQEKLEHYRNIPAIIIYYYIFQMIVKSEETYFFQVLEVLNNNTASFRSGERQNIYNYLQNYCIEHINKGEFRFLQQSFELYKAQLDQNLLADEDGFLSEWHFKNIVTVGIRLQEMEWIRDFIDLQSQRLRPSSRENAYTFNLAAYYYAAGKLEKVLELLLRVEYSDIRYNLDAKALLLRTYYDLDEYEAFISLSESFKQYLLRNKLISDFQRKGYNHLLRFAKRAFRIKNEQTIVRLTDTQRALKNLMKDIDGAKPIYNLSWLKRKVGELGNE